MVKRTFITACILVALVASVAIVWRFLYPPKIDVTLSSDVPIHYPGFEAFPTPRNFDGPGTVFRVTDTKEFIFVDQINLEILETEAENPPGTNVKKQWSGEITGRLLVGFTGSTELLQHHEIQVEIPSAIRRRVREADLDRAVRELQMNWDRPGSLYVIRETIAVSGLKLRFSGEIEDELKSELQNSVASGAVRLAVQERRIELEFDPAANMFFQADKLEKGLGIATQGAIRLRNEMPPVWDKEIRMEADK